MPEITPRSEPTLRVPVEPSAEGIYAIFFFFFVIVAALALSILSDGVFFLSGAIFLGAMAAIASVMAVATLVRAIRMVGLCLAIDDEGIWLVRGQSRRGLPWSEVVGYEIVKGNRVIVLSKSGRPMTVPRSLFVKQSRSVPAIAQALDRRIGPDGERPLAKRPADPLRQRVHDYYEDVPSVTIEPGVTYRYMDRDGLRRHLQARIRRDRIGFGFCLTMLVLMGIVLAFGETRDPDLVLKSVSLLAGITAVVFSLNALLRNLQLAGSIDDRFQLRDGQLIVLRPEGELPLANGQNDSGHRLLGQPVTHYGSHLHGYRLAPQFLEPDV